MKLFDLRAGIRGRLAHQDVFTPDAHAHITKDFSPMCFTQGESVSPLTYCFAVSTLVSRWTLLPTPS